MKATKLFYEKLYTNVDGDTNDSWIDEIKDSTEIPQISENDKLNMRKPISKDELFAIMKTFSKNKSPGNDGLTVEFYEKFWDLISEQLLKSSNESIEMGEMSASQKQSITTLLEIREG